EQATSSSKRPLIFVRGRFAYHRLFPPISTHDSIVAGTIDIEFLNLARDSVTPDTKAYSRIVLATMCMLERRLDQDGSKFPIQDIHAFRLPGCQQSRCSCFQQGCPARHFSMHRCSSDRCGRWRYGRRNSSRRRYCRQHTHSTICTHTPLPCCQFLRQVLG